MLEFNYNIFKRMVFGSSAERSRAVADQATEMGKVVNMFDAATEQQLKEITLALSPKKRQEKAEEEKYDTSSRKPKKKIVFKPTGRKEFPKKLLHKQQL